MPSCAAVYCTNSSKKGFLMKRFPKDKERREQWANKMKRYKWTPTDTSCLCEVHFAPEMWEKTREDGTRRLKINAVPTIFPTTKEKNKGKSSIKRCSIPTEQCEIEEEERKLFASTSPVDESILIPIYNVQDHSITDVKNIMRGPDEAPHVDKQEKLEGNRIINVLNFFEQLKQICSHGEPFSCSFNNLIIKSEVRIGLLSKFILQCEMCNKVFFLNSQETQGHQKNKLDLNSLALKGMGSIGGNCHSLEEFFDAINVPCMAEATLQNRHQIIEKAWQEVADNIMRQTVKEEINHVD